MNGQYPFGFGNKEELAGYELYQGQAVGAAGYAHDDAVPLLQHVVSEAGFLETFAKMEEEFAHKECLKCLTRPNRNQKGDVDVWMNFPEIPPTPLVKGGRGGISSICCQFARKFICKRLKCTKLSKIGNPESEV